MRKTICLVYYPHSYYKWENLLVCLSVNVNNKCFSAPYLNEKNHMVDMLTKLALSM